MLANGVGFNYDTDPVEATLKRAAKHPRGVAYYGAGFVDPLEAVRD